MIKVGVNGYHTIGRRVADAITKQSDMELIGVTKVHPDYKARLAVQKGINIYAIDEKGVETFRTGGISVRGTLHDLLQRVDVIVDTTPDGVGATYKPVYEGAKVKAIFQGGEDHSLTNLSFVAQCNFDEAKNGRMVRVVSCNTTGLCRTLRTIDTAFGVRRARAVLVRRAADPDEVTKGPIDSIVLDPPTIPSHHASDVQSVLHGIDIVTMAVKVPSTHMHLHSLIVSLKKTPRIDQVLGALDSEPRLMLVEAKAGFKSTSAIMDLAREMGRTRDDMYEAIIWRDSVSLVSDELYLFLGVHQEAIVIPENIDAIRALDGATTMKDSMRLTDESLGIARKSIGS